MAEKRSRPIAPGMTRGDRAPWGRLDAADSAAALARLLGAPQFPLLGLLAVAGVRHGVEGVLAGTELEAHRRAADLEHLAEGVGQVAAVGLGQRLGLVAVDHDDRRVAAALVGHAQLDPPDRKSV